MWGWSMRPPHPFDDDQYSVMMLVPVNNLLNEIIYNQAQDLRVDGQERLIDYLLSGAANVEDDQSDDHKSNTLEQLREKLMSLGAAFDDLKLKHDRLIVRSQKTLKGFSQHMPSDSEIKQTMEQSQLESKLMTEEFKIKREEFRNILIEVRDSISRVPGYRSETQSSNDEKNLNMYNVG